MSGHERISCNDRDVTFKRSIRHTESIDVSEGLMPFTEGFKVMDWDEKISTDHRGHLIELNLEQFF